MIFACSNVKGGVGKSTLAVHLYFWLKARDLQVVLVDCDVQQSSSRWLTDIDPTLDYVRLSEPTEVRPVLKTLAKDFPAIVVDGPAGLTDLNYRILMISDVCLVPCGPSLLDLEASQLVIAAIKEAQETRAGKPAALFVGNKVQPHLRLSRDMLETAQSIGIPLATTPIRLRQAFPDARSVCEIRAQNVGILRKSCGGRDS
jgi:chromosome partitioning protein